MADGIHSGHRERVRKEFLAHGFNEDTPPHKIVEMLLYYSIPRKDTNEIAHELVDRFGSVSGILDADPNELTEIKGVSENTAALIMLIKEIIGIYRLERREVKSGHSCISEVYDLLLSKYYTFKNEVLLLTTLNGKGEIIAIDKIGEGDYSTVKISIRDIIECILKRRAIYAILSHNHPNSTAVPSSDDVRTTEQIFNVLKSIGIVLLDHIIIADDDYVSMRQSKDYSYIFKNTTDNSIV